MFGDIRLMCLWQVSDQNRSCPFIMYTLIFTKSYNIKIFLFPIFFLREVLVRKLFCSFFNPLISLYIYYDQLSMKKIWRKKQNNVFPRFV